MALEPLTDAFEMRGPMAMRAPWQVPRDEHLLELRAELDRRRTVYRGLVDRNTLTAEQAKRYCAILRGAIAHYDHRAPREPGVDHDMIVRELRREIALRRNAYPKWVKSPTHALSADAAATHMERIEAVHWSFWMDLDGFTPAGRDETEDLARHQLVIRLEREAREPGWNTPIPGCLHARKRDARRERRAWIDLARLVNAMEAGQQLLSSIDSGRLGELRMVVTEAAERALDATVTDPAQGYRFGRLYPLATWLQRLALAPCGPMVRGTAVDQRKAA